MADTWKMIDTRMTQLGEIHKRMDTTKDLVYLSPYQLKNFRDQKMSNVINVTGNKAATFGSTIIADLVQVKWQTVVEGKITLKQAHQVEQFIEDNLAQADEYLLERYGLVGLYEWLCNHVCIRGPIGAEWVASNEDGRYKVHCLPLDMRWAAFQYGRDGLSWVAPITFRSKEDLAEEFPEFESRIKGTPGTTEIEVRDYWDKEKNELWINKELIRTQPNSFGKVPYVIVFPPAGFLLRDKGYLKHEAEDIFYLVRGLNDELNRTLSIEQSLIFNALRPPYEKEVEILTAEPSQPVPLTGESIDVKKGERHIPVPTGDLNRANLAARQDIFRMMDEGAPVAPRLYTSPPSGAELLAEMEALARLQNSRIVALKVFREQLARMIIDQYLIMAKGGTALDIGKKGRRGSYSVAQLKDPDSYSITCQSITKSKKQELANLAMFSAAYNRLPLRYNLTNILMVEDPEGVMRELEIEQARKADPAISLAEMGVRYAEEAEEMTDEAEEADKDLRNFESMLLIERAVSIIKQRQQPAPPQLPGKAQVPQVEEPKGGGQGLISLLGRDGMGGRPPVQQQEAVAE